MSDRLFNSIKFFNINDSIQNQLLSKIKNKFKEGFIDSIYINSNLYIQMSYKIISSLMKEKKGDLEEIISPNTITYEFVPSTVESFKKDLNFLGWNSNVNNTAQNNSYHFSQMNNSLNRMEASVPILRSEKKDSFYDNCFENKKDKLFNKNLINSKNNNRASIKNTSIEENLDTKNAEINDYLLESFGSNLTEYLENLSIEPRAFDGRKSLNKLLNFYNLLMIFSLFVLICAIEIGLRITQ